MIDVGTWEDFLRFVKRSSWAWNSLLGQEDERKLLGFLGTKVASTSGTAIDFTGIPSWVTQISINFAGVSTNNSSSLIVQIGDAGGIETLGYLGAAHLQTNGGASVVANFTTGFGVSGAVGANSTIHGTMTLTLEDATAFTWVAVVSTGYSDNVQASGGGGSKSTSAALDRIRITSLGGTDAFDAGSINVWMT